MATTMEVNHRRLGGSGLGVVLGLCLGKSFDGGIEAVDIGLVVLGVVKLHDLARDGGLKGAVVV